MQISAKLLRTSVEKLQIWLKSEENIRRFTRTPKYILLLQEIYIRYKSIPLQQAIVLYCWQWHAPEQCTQNKSLRFRCKNFYITHHNVTSYVHYLHSHLSVLFHQCYIIKFFKRTLCRGTIDLSLGTFEQKWCSFGDWGVSRSHTSKGLNLIRKVETHWATHSLLQLVLLSFPIPLQRP